MEFFFFFTETNGLNTRENHSIIAYYLHVVPPAKAKCFKRKHHMFDISTNILYLSTCLVQNINDTRQTLHE